MRDHTAGAGRSVVMSAAVLSAVWLTAAPLLMLLVAAFRGPGDRLPFEPETIWTLEHLRTVYGDPVLYRVTIPETAIFVAGSVSLAFTVAFILAWLVESGCSCSTGHPRSDPRTAAALGVHGDTVKRDWRIAKLWLLKAMEEGRQQS